MGNADFDQYSHQHQKVEIPPPNPFLKTLKSNVKETLFPDDPFRKFKNQPLSKKISLGLQYFVPILDWAPRYNFQFFKADVIAGITIASLAVPQGISYAGLANLPPVIGLYSSFVPPMIYAMMGSSKHLAIGNVAVPSLLISAMLGKVINPHENPKLYLQLVFTATFFAGVFQASLGLLRLGFIVDFLSHATILGFMGGAATIVCLQQLKGILGLAHFTHQTDIVSVMSSIFSQIHQWRWESGVLGCCFLFFLLLTRYFSKKKPAFFWINAMAPLTSVILGSVLVYFTHAEKNGVQVIGHLKKGINPPSYSELTFSSQYLTTAIKTGIVTSVIALAEGIAVGRSFAIMENYDIDGNKEMIAFGLMNIAGSCTSCYLTTGPFSRTAVNYNAGCKTAVSNIVMATAVMITLLLLTPLFHYTPIVVLSSIIISAMLGIIDYNAAIHLWKVDKYDFLVCISSYIGVVFGSVEVGLIVAVAMSLLRVLLFVARPKTNVLGKIPNSMTYRSTEQYSVASSVQGVLIIHIDAPIYFANASYLRESANINPLNAAVGNIDTSGISMLEEVKRIADRRCLQVLLANPGGEVMKKLAKSNFIDTIGKEWIYLTVGEAVNACNYILHTCKFQSKRIDSSTTPDDSV
ncbi:hypothetical protein RND71_022747 [Anisodus tanguticus]|uniref:STAS domain-containing protein n=1 Tax=Anisodus tanguticus TaxID=243964 RepID=A0AAE1RUA1_9SOLA|nr:hypothetical protein RND71_022747 [Anisodus tanguticus]